MTKFKSNPKFRSLFEALTNGFDKYRKEALVSSKQESPN